MNFNVQNLWWCLECVQTEMSCQLWMNSCNPADFNQKIQRVTHFCTLPCSQLSNRTAFHPSVQSIIIEKRFKCLNRHWYSHTTCNNLIRISMKMLYADSFLKILLNMGSTETEINVNNFKWQRMKFNLIVFVAGFMCGTLLRETWRTRCIMKSSIRIKMFWNWRPRTQPH